MKIKITPMMKDLITVSEMAIVRDMVTIMRDDSGLKEYAAIAGRIAARDNSVEVLKAEAELSKNYRVINRYSDNSGLFDIWLNIYAFSSEKGFYVIGAYLSDIWDVTGNNSEKIRNYMYIREFKEME